MRTVLDEAGVPVPAYLVVDEGPGALDAVETFAADPRLARHAQGGPRRLRRQGRLARRRPAQAATVLAGVAGQVVVEELLPLDAELAVVVARRPSGASAAWPAVETAQVGGVCREVLVPGRLDGRCARGRPRPWARRWPRSPGAVGVMAVELFWSGDRLLVNEVATRPHNSGHWTMEGAVTSQFENHVRAVLDLPLGSTAPQHPQVASVNVFGGAGRRRSRPAPGPRPGRRGRPRPPVWQARPAGTQTGARDGLWRRSRGGAVPGLVGRHRPRHARARRHRPAGGGAPVSGPGPAGRRRHGELVRPARHAGGRRRARANSASPTRCGSSPPTARPATCWPSGRMPPAGGSGSSSPEPVEPPTCPACWPRSPPSPSSGSRWRSPSSTASTACSPSSRCPRASRWRPWPSTAPATPACWPCASWPRPTRISPPVMEAFQEQIAADARAQDAAVSEAAASQGASRDG